VGVGDGDAVVAAALVAGALAVGVVVELTGGVGAGITLTAITPANATSATIAAAT